MNLFPAVLIGGPPHAGKSVLAYGLTQVLRRQQVEHYVLRAYPDGEGDWSSEAEPHTVRALRVKGRGSQAWVDRICRDIDRRRLPLIVDPGGRPTSWQEAVFDHCTHAILLTPGEESRQHWRAMMARHGIPLLADLHSSLQGEGAVEADQDVLRGTLAGLRRQTTASGPAFDALVQRLDRLFAYPEAELRHAYLQTAPLEITVELDRLKRALRIDGDPTTWEPSSLPQAIDYLPEGVPLALYGRGPNWLYAALALVAHPSELSQFDPRLGWVSPVPLRLGIPDPDAPLLRASVHAAAEHARIEFSLPASYIDYEEAEGQVSPCVSPERGVVLSGKLPHWLWTGLALAYRQAPWLAVYQPQVGGAVVVHSPAGLPPLGSIL